MTRYGVALVAISCFDLIFTLVGIHFGWLYEWSFILSYVLASYGVILFGVCHIIPLVVGVVLLETLWHTMPEHRLKWRRYYLFVLGGYIGIFGFAVLFQGAYLFDLL